MDRPDGPSGTCPPDFETFAMTDEWLTVVAPSSVRSWFKHFSSGRGSVLFTGEGPDDLVGLANRLEDCAEGRGVRIHSGHDSLLRDWAVSRELLRRGVKVESQSGMAVAAGIDKVLQKRLLAQANIPVPSWGGYETVVPAGVRALVKGRNSTQSRGLAWVEDSEGDRPPESYWEAFMPGVEYSVVLYCTPGGRTVLPTVWKGRVREDLLPPWRRQRLVPSGLSPQVEKALRETAVAVADLLDAWGFIEVEFIVSDDGVPFVIDVNPRICGTMRIAAMASGVQLFNLSDLELSGTHFVNATRFAAEVPYEGEPFAEDGVVATSRLTCAAESPQSVCEILAVHGYAESTLDWPGPWVAD